MKKLIKKLRLRFGLISIKTNLNIFIVIHKIKKKIN